MPTIRLRYRHEVLAEERAYLRRGALAHTTPDTPPPPVLQCFASTKQDQPESLPGPADFGSSPTLSALRQPAPQGQVARMSGSQGGSRRGSGTSIGSRTRGPVPLYGSMSSAAPRSMRIPQPTLLDMAAQSPVAAAALAEVTGSTEHQADTGAHAASGAAPAAEESSTVSADAPAPVLHHVASRDRIAQGLAGLAGDALPQSK